MPGRFSVLPLPVKSLSLFLAILLGFSLFSFSSDGEEHGKAEDDESVEENRGILSVSLPEDLPQTSATAAVLMEAESRTLLYGCNEDLPLPMASTTKIMTALAILRLCALDDTVEITAEAVGIEGSSMYLEQGEHLTVEALLYGLLLASANDAAVALAIHAAGSIENFVLFMNAEAHRLGLTATHFVTVNGLDDPDHYTTARELALLTSEALEQPTFRKIVSAKEKVVVSGEGRRFFLQNHNRLLREYDGCIGVKTGYTMRSGRCLVSAAEREGMTLIAVTLCDRQDWKDHKALLDYGFSHYRRQMLCEKETVFARRGGDVLGTPVAVTVLLDRDASEQADLSLCLYSSPQEDGCLGKAVFVSDGRMLAEIPLYALDDS